MHRDHASMAAESADVNFTVAEFCEAGLLCDQYLQIPCSREGNQARPSLSGQLSQLQPAKSPLPESPSPLRGDQPPAPCPAYTQSQGNPLLTEPATCTSRLKELNRKHQKQYRQREKVVATVAASCRTGILQEAVQKVSYSRVLRFLLVLQERLQALKTQLARTEDELARSKQQQQDLEKILMNIQINKKPAFLCVPALHQQQNLVRIYTSAHQAVHKGQILPQPGSQSSFVAGETNRPSNV